MVRKDEEGEDEGFAALCGLVDDGGLTLALDPLLWLARRAGDRADGPGLLGEREEGTKTKGGPDGGWKGSFVDDG